MAYNKVYKRTYWNDNGTPDMDATNFNNIEKGIDDIDTRVVEIGNDVIDVKSGLLDYQNKGYLPKNLCDGVNQSKYLDGSCANFGTATGDSGLIIKVDVNTNYTVSTKSTQTRYRVALVDNTDRGSAYNGVNKDGTNQSITVNSGTHQYLIVNATDLTIIQVEKGSVATEYAPFISQSIAQLNNSLMDMKMLGYTIPKECPIQNVYTETTATIKVGRVDLSKLSWTSAWTNAWYSDNQVLDIKYNTTYANYENKMWSSQYKLGNPINGTVGAVNCWKSGSDIRLAICTGSSSKPTGYLYYELANPITIPIDGSEAVERVNDSLNAQGLLNKYDGNFVYGYINNSGSIASSSVNKTTSNFISCKSGDRVIIETNGDSSNTTIIGFYNNGTFVTREYTTISSSYETTVPDNVNQFKVSFASNASSVVIYVNNDIRGLKADLNSLSGGSNYSTTETVIGKWIDGRNIYRKTFVTNNYSVVANSRQYIDLLGSVDFIINQSGYVRGKTNDYLEQDARLNIPFYFYSGDFGAYELECKAFVSSNDTMKLFIMWNTGATLNIAVSVDYVKK